MSVQPIEDGLCRTIAPRDEMFGGDIAQYLTIGQSALDCIQFALAAAHRSPFLDRTHP